MIYPYSSPKKKTQRQLKAAELIKKNISTILSKYSFSHFPLEELSITIGEVVVSSDLKKADIFIYPLNKRDKKTILLNALNYEKGRIRYLLGRSIRMKFCPEITFFLDDLFDRIEDRDALFSSPEVRQDL